MHSSSKQYLLLRRSSLFSSRLLLYAAFIFMSCCAISIRGLYVCSGASSTNEFREEIKMNNRHRNKTKCNTFSARVFYGLSLSCDYEDDCHRRIKTRANARYIAGVCNIHVLCTDVHCTPQTYLRSFVQAIEVIVNSKILCMTQSRARECTKCLCSYRPTLNTLLASRERSDD